MSLVNMKDLVDAAQKDGSYAVGSFTIANMEMVKGTIQAAEALNAPIIIQIAEARLCHSPLELVGPMMVSAARYAKVPVAVHFDHGTTMEKITQALEMGFTSTMIDASMLPLEENVAMTKQVISLAGKYGASVEAEIGHVGGSEDGSQNNAVLYSTPHEAFEMSKTGIATLAVAIGNAHGVYQSEPKLNFEVLESIHKAVNTPLVLHGGSGITDEDFRRCIDHGIYKINIASATFQACAKATSALMQENPNSGYFAINEAMVEASFENVKRHILVFRSENRA